MATPTSTGPRASQIAGLAVIVVTGLVFAVILGSTMTEGLDDMKIAAAAFSALCGAIAVFAMFVDLSDLWLRGRRLTPVAAKLLRVLVIVAILAAMATAPLGGKSYIPIMLLPAAAIYYFGIRPTLGPRRRVALRPGKPTAQQTPVQAQPVKSRQRRGGKNRR